MLEVASELVGAFDWPDKQVKIYFREQDAPEWRFCFFASDAANSVGTVANGEADFAICNPGGVLAMALHGVGPFEQPVPVRAIIVLPQYDRWGFAVTKSSGITSIQEIAEKAIPASGVAARRTRQPLGPPLHGHHSCCARLYP
jgi:hypothetical protein